MQTTKNMRPYPTACTPGFPRPTWRNPDWRADYDERYAPVPGWGVNPMLACPSQVGVGAFGEGSSSPSVLSDLVRLALPAGIGILAMMATRHFAHRDASGATYAIAGGAGLGGAIVGSIGGLALCSAMAPAPTGSATPTAADATVLGGWLTKCLTGLLIGSTVGAVAGGVLVGRKQGR